MQMKAVIFDMDGTLIDSLMIWDVLWSKLGETYLNNKDFRPSKEDDKAVRTLTAKDAMSLIHKKYNIGKSGEELLNFSNRIIIDFYSNTVMLKTGVREFLEYCKERGVKMCLATATAPDLLYIALERCDIAKYFLKIFSCGDIGKGKEHPDIFLLAQNFLGEKIEDTWVIEDSLVAIETATKAGFSTVGIYDQFNYGQEKIKEISTVYIEQGETLLKLIKE